MRKKITFLKTFLIAAGLCMGSSAWAGDVTTIYERGGVETAWSTSDIVTSALTTDKWYSVSTGNTGLSIENSVLKVSARGKTTTGTGTLTLNRTANTIVTLSAIMNTGSSTYPSNDNCITFQYGAFKINYYTRNSNAEYYVNSTKTSLPTLANNIDLSIDLMVNSINGEITALSVKRLDTSAEIIKLSDLGTNTFFNAGTDYESVIFQSYCNVSSNNTLAYLKSIIVRQETQDVATANYTVKWAYENGTVVKSEIRNAAVGSDIGLNATDMNAFFNEDKTVKYLCLSNDVTGKTVASDGSTVITIKIRNGEKYKWTVTTSYNGNALDYFTEGEVWEDESNVFVAYPRFQSYGTQLVEKTPVGNDLRQSISVTQDNFTVDFAYTAVNGVDNLYLLSEAENLGTGISTSSTNFQTRVSNGSIINASEGTLLSLPAGKYIFTLGAIGGDTNTHQVNYTVNAGGEQIITGKCTGNFLSLLKSEEFVLTENADITFTCSDPASNRGIDLIYIQKTADILVSTTELEGYKTFYNATKSFEVDANTTIYKAAQVSGDKVVITAVEGKIIPAGQAVILKTTATDYAITLTETTTASSGDFSGNALQAATSKGAIAGAYILAYTTADGFGFYQFTGSLDAGDVYVTAAAGAKLRVSVEGDDATDIKAIATEEVKDNVIYNLSGQRVVKPLKGIYIQNGKKILVK